MIYFQNGRLGIEQGGSLNPSGVSFPGAYGINISLGNDGTPATLASPLTTGPAGGSITVGAGSTLASPINVQSLYLDLIPTQGSLVSGSISGPGGVRVSGGLGGTASLSGANTFTGGLTVSGPYAPTPAFTLQVPNPQALGNGTVAVMGCTLDLTSSPSTWSNPITLDRYGVLEQAASGTATWSGLITANTGFVSATTAASTLKVTGGIQGNAPIDAQGSGTVIIAGSSASPSFGPNTFNIVQGSVHLILQNAPNAPALTGASVQLSSGTTLEMAPGSDNQIAASSELDISGASVNISSTTQTIAAVQFVDPTGGTLSGTGTLTTGSVNDGAQQGPDDTITVGRLQLSGSQPWLQSRSKNLVINSPISGTGGVHIRSYQPGSTGNVIFTRDNTYTGTTTVDNGLFIVGSQPQSPVLVTSTGYLSGSGSAGDVTSQAGFVAPDGQLHVTSLTLDAQSSFGTLVYGTRPGTDYGQILTPGPVNLGSSSLVLDFQYPASLGNSFTVIHSQSAAAVNGTFAGLPEGAHFVDGPYTLAITYRGGTGHDVVATVINPSLLQLDAFGGLHIVGGAPIDTAGAPYWPGWGIARGVAVRVGNDGGYELDGWGGVHAFGHAPQVAQGAYWPNWDIARGLILRPDGQSGYVLDGWGGVHPFGHAPPVAQGAYWPHWDIARAIAPNPCDRTGESGYILDGWGGVHPFGGAPPVTASAYWPGWSIARSITVDYQCDGGAVLGWVLDGWGGVHPFVQQGYINPSPPQITGYWPNWDIARAIVTTGPQQGYVLDGWGSAHPFGGAPPVGGGGFWPGWDVLRAAGTS